MKNLYAFLGFVLFAGISFAQQVSTETKAVENYHANRPANGVSGDRATPFWTEDFGNGIPSTWAVIDSSGICPWRYSYDGSWGFWSTDGETMADPPIASTTSGNGFIICDPDSANHFNYGQPSGTTYSYLASYIGTDAIDCSGHASVILTFEHNYRYNNGVPMWVQVSTDSSTWTSFDVSGGIANNTESADPDLETVNLSSIAGNQSTVYLRFGWSARVYYWMIDDINLSEADPYDVVNEGAFWGSGNFQYQQHKIPTSQWSPITFYGELMNNTGNAMTDVYFDVDVSGAAFSGTSNLIPLNPVQMDTATSTTNWTPSATGSHTITWTADITGQTDGNMANNTFTDSIELTNSIYATDNLPPSLQGATGVISNWSGNSGMAFGIGNVIEVIADAEIECAEIGISSDAQNEGLIIFGAVYYWDGAAWVYIDQTLEYTVQNADLGSVVSLQFPNSISVTAGQEVIVAACHLGGDVEFLMAQSVDDATVWGYDGNYDWFWLSNPRAIVSRADLDCVTSGMDELDDGASVSLFPNPASEIVNIEVNLNENSVVYVDVYDISGKLVHQGTPVQYDTGSNIIHIDVDVWQAGTYTAEIHVNDTQTTQQLIVK